MLLSISLLCLSITVIVTAAAPEDSVKIVGGDFHNNGGFKLQEKPEAHPMRNNKRPYKAEESAVTISGGDFHKRDTSEAIDDHCKGYRGRNRRICRLYYAAVEDNEDSSDNMEQPLRVITGGNHKGLGQGEGSLSDITGAKDHVITNGDFHDFGDIAG